MNRPTLGHLTRPAVLALLLAAVLLLGAHQRAWATPAQSPARQTVPTATPGGPTIPDVTPPPSTTPGEVRQVVAPGVATTVTTGDGAAAVVLPANALSAAGTLVVRPVPADVAPPAGAGFALLGKTIEITLFDVQGNPIAHPSFANPIQVCFAYTADDLAKAGGTDDALVVQFYDTSVSKWVTLPTALDASSSRMCGSVTHFSLFSLAARSSAPRALPPTGAADLPSSLPKTGASAATAVPAWIWAVSALALAVGGALTLRFRQMKRK